MPTAVPCAGAKTLFGSAGGGGGEAGRRGEVSVNG